MIDFVAIIVVVGWLVSLCVALFVVPKLAAARAMENFGLMLVDQDGKKFYTPLDLEGKPYKVPVGVKKDAEDKETIVYGYAPLAYCLPFMAADMAAQKIRFMLMSAKGKVAREWNKAGVGGELLEAGLDAATAGLVANAPAKIRPWLALAAKYLTANQQGQGGVQPPGQSPRSGKPI